MAGADGRLVHRTLRLRFRPEPDGLALVTAERVEMISPPAPGARPVPGESSGFWLELRDRRDRTVAHRVVSRQVVGSVEVFSPDGTIRRVVGAVPVSVFEVLLPDVPGAAQVVLVGEPPPDGCGPAPTRELARFVLPF